MTARNPTNRPLLPVDVALDDFLVHLRAKRRSERTRDLYSQSVNRLSAWLTAHDRSIEVTDITRRDIDRFLADLHGEVNPGTVALHFRNLRAFFNWLANEGEIDASPMHRMGEPSVPDVPPEVLSEEQLTALFTSCKGRGFDERRDLAVLMVFADTGCRLGEVHGLRVDGLNRETRTLVVCGKGDKTRVVALGDRAMDAMVRYLRVRGSHRHAGTSSMWLGRNGPLTSSGIAQILDRRAQQAGIDHLNPHRFRHTFAHQWMAAGGQESDLMLIAGWTSPEMVRRYGRSAAADRAREAQRRLSPVDRLA